VSASVMSGLTYDDLAGFPQDDHLRRELIDGELFVSPSPVIRHQRAVVRIAGALLAFTDQHGGLAVPAPMDVVFSPQTVVEPDVVFIGPVRVNELDEERFVDIVPDLVVEVSSPSTRRLDLVKKRNLYEREGVAEYWFVDLEADQIDVHRRDSRGMYGMPMTLGEDATLTCLAAPGFELSVAEALSR
jgi:Uma2 family endonuclease